MEAAHPSSSPLQMISDQPRVWLQLAEQTLAFPAPKASLLPLDLWKQLENQPHTDVSTARPHSCEPLSSPGPSISQSLAQDHGGGGGEGAGGRLAGRVIPASGQAAHPVGPESSPSRQIPGQTRHHPLGAQSCFSLSFWPQLSPSFPPEGRETQAGVDRQEGAE